VKWYRNRSQTKQPTDANALTLTE